MKLQNIFGFNTLVFLLCFALISPNLYAKWLPPQAQEQPLPEKAVGPMGDEGEDHPASKADETAKDQVPNLEDMGVPLNTDHETDIATHENQVSAQHHFLNQIEILTFAGALEALSREGISSAVRVDDLSASGLEQLAALDEEIGGFVLSDGTIILYKSGDESSLKMLRPAVELMQSAVLHFHTHPEGGPPSSTDLEQASSGREYILYPDGSVTAYNQNGVEDDALSAADLSNEITQIVSNATELPREEALRAALFIKLLEQGNRVNFHALHTARKSNGTLPGGYSYYAYIDGNYQYVSAGFDFPCSGGWSTECATEAYITSFYVLNELAKQFPGYEITEYHIDKVWSAEEGEFYHVYILIDKKWKTDTATDTNPS